jgi:hypothetical protein
MPGSYHPGERGLQDRFHTRRLADRIDERLVRDVIRAEDRVPERRLAGRRAPSLGSALVNSGRDVQQCRPFTRGT